MVLAELKSDIVVLGSGVAGLTAALSASLAGMSAIILEHEEAIGGTSALSSGTVWIPDNHYMRAYGASDDREKASQYLASLVGNHGPPEIWQSFLDKAPQMLEALARDAGIEFRPFMTAPDYRQDHPGASAGGRALEPLEFDGRSLGVDFKRLANPLPEFLLFGGMMITRAEAAELLRADRSQGAAVLGIRLLCRYFLDRLRYRRGTRLVLGNALVARLFKAASDRGVKVICNAHSRKLIRKGADVVAVEVGLGDKETRINARCGVILAGGGFPANREKREEYLPKPVAEYTPAAPGCDGSTIELALAVGAKLGPEGLDNALWFPSSISRRDDGSTAVWPHIVLDRSKPGMIAVDQTGHRFTNEAVSYHEFVRAMYRANKHSPTIPAWLVCDVKTIRKYGMGLVKPRGIGLSGLLRKRYLIRASSIGELAEKLGISRDAFEKTIVRYNRFAETGTDKDFRKGENIYDRSNGDPEHSPNPCIGPLSHPPFYAVSIYPTPLGTSRGLAANANAQVLDDRDNPIPGLYVCGNDMQSPFGGEYPGAGSQLGQAMTFAWLAANHAATIYGPSEENLAANHG